MMGFPLNTAKQLSCGEGESVVIS